MKKPQICPPPTMVQMVRLAALRRLEETKAAKYKKERAQ